MNNREQDFFEEDRERGRVLSRTQGSIKRYGHKKKKKRLVVREVDAGVKGGVPVSVRVRFSTIASLASYLYEQDERFYSKSTTLRTFLELVADDIQERHEEHRFNTESDAIKFLDEVGILNEGRNTTTKRAVDNELQIDSIMGGRGELKSRFRAGPETNPTPDGSSPDEVMLETLKHLGERQRLIQQVSGSVETVSKSTEAQRLEENRQMALSRMTPIEVPVIDLDKPVGSAVETPEEAATRRENELKAEKLTMLAMIQNASRKEESNENETEQS